MAKSINTVSIENFKSLKKLTLEKCANVNIILGKPNVGKSSILEALSLLGNHSGERFFSDFVHYETVANLFFDHEIHQRNITISTDIGSCSMSYNEKKDNFLYQLFSEQDSEQQAFATNVGRLGKGFDSIESPIPMRRYDYRRLTKHDGTFSGYLQPPAGTNLLSIFQTSAELRTQIAPLFAEYGLELELDLNERVIKIQKRKDGLTYSLPYSMVADTLQRMILCIAAIFSNKNAILLFEEPEAHAFPPFVKMLADHIALDEENQYFITTHSPYLLQTLARETDADVAVFVVDIVNHETVARRIEGASFQRLLDEGSSVFFNLERL